MVFDTALATPALQTRTQPQLGAILALLSQVFAVFAFFIVVTLFAATAARADNERPLQINPDLLLPLPDLIPPKFGYDDGIVLPVFHALSGTWWAHTLFDEQGNAIWHGGQNSDSVVLRIDMKGQFSTRDECNFLNGSFNPAGDDGQVSVNPMMASTLMLCWDEYPPTIGLTRIARFEKEGFELRLFDENDQPVATMYNMHGLAALLDDLLN